MIACRADHVGSLLRPGFLLDAREQHAAGSLSDAKFKQIEVRALLKDDRLVDVARGNPVTADVQAHKLRLVAQVARQVWRD